MNKILILLFSFLLVLSSLAAYGQRDNKKPAKIVGEKPGVFISEVKPLPESGPSPSSVVWLQLNNNYRWGISVCHFDKTDVKQGIVGLHYEMEAMDQSRLINSSHSDSTTNSPTLTQMPRGNPTFDFCDEFRLKSGTTIRFKVPRSEFVRWARLKVPFFMEWEDINQARTGREPLHSVVFYSLGLINE